MDQFCKVAARFNITRAAEQAQMLEALHQFGLLLHYQEKGLNDMIILDPQWLLDSFSAVIRDFSLHIQPKDRAALERHSDWMQLKDEARLDAALLPYIWSDHSPTERKICLSLMCKHNLAVALRESNDCNYRLDSSDKMCNDPNDIYLIPSLLPFDLDHRPSEDELTDALSSKFQTRLPKYSAVENESGMASLYFAFHLSLPIHRCDVKVSELEKHGLLPAGLYTRLLCHMVQEQQYTSSQARNLVASRTSSTIMFGNAQLQLDCYQHICAIRMRAEQSIVIRLMHRVESAIKQVIDSAYPALRYVVLLPFDKNSLVVFSSALELAEERQTMALRGHHIPLAPMVQYPYIQPQHGLKSFYHGMISYRRSVNSSFALRLYELLSSFVLQNGEPMQIFIDQYGISAGKQFVVEFCSALQRSGLALPVVSLHALQDMALAVQRNKPDYLLLEWELMLVLHDNQLLNAVLPLCVGDSWCNEQGTIEVRTLKQFVTLANEILPEKVSEKTHDALSDFLKRYTKLDPPKKRTVKDIVSGILKFKVLKCFQSSPEEQQKNWDGFGGYASSIRNLVEDILATYTSTATLGGQIKSDERARGPVNNSLQTKTNVFGSYSASASSALAYPGSPRVMRKAGRAHTSPAGEVSVRFSLRLFCGVTEFGSVVYFHFACLSVFGPKI